MTRPLLLTTALACALGVPAVGPPRIAAAEPAQATDGDDDGDSRAEAQRLYTEGKARYETLDYAGAIELWTKAYALVPEGDQGREIRAALVYNIAQAQEKAYDVDGDVVHLRQARGLLERYLADFEALYGDTPDNAAEADKIRARIQELDDRITKASATAGGPTDSRAAARAAKEEARRRREEQRRKDLEHRKRANALLAKDPKLAAQVKKSKTMIISGGVVLGVGALTLSAAAVLFYNGFAIGGGVTAGAGLLVATPGAVLLGLGVPQGKRARAEAMRRTEVAVSPTLLPSGGGLSLAGRF